MVLELVGGGDLFTVRSLEPTLLPFFFGHWKLRMSKVEVLTSRPNSRFSDREAAYVGKQLAEGLSFLHGRGQSKTEG